MPSRKLLGAAAMTAALTAGGIVGATVGYPSISGAQSGTTPTTTSVPATGTPPGDHGPGRGGRGFADLSVAAKALGMTEADLRTALQGGKSLADVAKDKGVDKQKVIDALVADAEKRLDEAKAELPDRIAAMVDGTMPAGGPGGRGPGGPGFGDRGQRLTVAAKALGMTEADLRTALQGGTSLADVAKDKGVDKQKVIDALVADAKARLAEAVKAGKLTQAEANTRSADLATHIASEVDEVHQGGPGGHGGHGPMGDHPDGPPPADGTAPATPGGN